MEDVSFETADGRCYNLNGQCLTNPMKELCIKKGRAGMMLVRPSTDQNIFVFFYKECLLFRFFLLSLHRKVTSFRGVAFEVFIICFCDIVINLHRHFTIVNRIKTPKAYSIEDINWWQKS